MRVTFTSITDLPSGTQTRLMALNNDHCAETSFLDDDAWRSLVAEAFAAWAAPAGDAFIIACDQTARYNSPNFLWFRERYRRFVYVDRIVVAPSARGRGLARALYDRLFEAARSANHDCVVCEVNTDPPNPGSDAFHDALRFVEVGRARLHDREKSVRYLKHDLSHA